MNNAGASGIVYRSTILVFQYCKCTILVQWAEPNSNCKSQLIVFAVSIRPRPVMSNYLTNIYQTLRDHAQYFYCRYWKILKKTGNTSIADTERFWKILVIPVLQILEDFKLPYPYISNSKGPCTIF
jgi:hypothetical protein